MRARAGWIVAAALALAMTPDAARAQSPAECRAVLESLNVPDATTAPRPCRALSTFIVGMSQPVRTAAERFLSGDGGLNPAEVFSDREFQSRHPQHAALGGTAAQAEAIPSVRPAALAAGSVAMVGSDAGSDALAALTVNPAIFFLADHATESLTQLSRFMDVSLFIPVTDADAAPAEPDALDYLGLRLRMNVHGLDAGSQLWERAEALLLDWVQDRGQDVQRVEELLAEAPDLERCTQALVDFEEDAIRTFCGRPITFTVRPEDVEELRGQFDRIRRQADSRYYGADIRLDWGDPTLGAVPGAAAASIFAGLAYGRRFEIREGAGSYGFRARLGARHASLQDTEGRQLGAEGGLGFDLSRTVGFQEFSAAAGVEGRWGEDTDLASLLQTNYAILRGSVIVPIAAGNSLSIALGVPVAGDVSSFLTVNFNWGLLFPTS